MIPPLFCDVHPRFRTPWKGSLITGAFCALLAGVLPLDILGELVSIGTLLAFVIVCAGVMVLRVRRPKREAAVPHAACLDRGAARHRHVPVHDGVPAARYLDPAGRVDADRR
jgi:hypothetical protein